MIKKDHDLAADVSQQPRNLTRRIVMAAGAATGIAAVATAACAASFGDPDLPPEGAINVTNPKALTDPGPQDAGIANSEPSYLNPPATDVNGMATFRASFNLAPKRIQNGGRARQITQSDFAISTTISGVNMRLGPNGIRELHWHQQAEWAVMTYGTCRITILDTDGQPQVADVKEGDLWYFPAGLPHSLQGLEPDGCEFVIAFDNRSASEFNTLLLTDWIAHTLTETLSKNFGVPVSAFSGIPLSNKWIYQSNQPIPSLATVTSQMASTTGNPPNPFVFSLADQPPVRQTKSGSVRIADSTNFLVSKTIAATLVTIKPGGMREMHWHPNADEWQYYLKGQGRVTVFNTGPAAITADFYSGDIGYVQKALGHYVENIGTTALVFMEVFRAERFEQISLSDWLVHSPTAMVSETLNIAPSVVAKFPATVSDVIPV